MQAWQDFVQRSNGDAVPNAFIVVHTWPADVLATIYSTNSTSTPITSQLRADANGRYEFYADDGKYKIYITGDSIEQQTREIILFDQTAGTSSLSIGYLPAGTGAVATTVQTKLRESVSVKDFGAVGNGVTDDTAAFNLAIGFINVDSSSLYIPKGTYKITSSLNTITKPCLIHGDGKDVSVVSQYSTTAITFTADSQSACVFENFQINHINTCTAGAGIKLTYSGSGYMSQPVVDKVTIIKGWKSVWIDRATGTQIIDPYFVNFNFCGIHNDNSYAADTGDNRIIGGIINSTSANTDGVYFTAGGGLTVVGTKFLGCVNSVHMALSSGANTSDFQFIGCSLEGSSGGAFKFERQSTTGSFSNIVILGCQISNQSSTYGFLSIPTDATTPSWLFAFSIIGNTVRGSNNSPITLNSGNQFKITGNMFINDGAGTNICMSGTATNIDFTANKYLSFTTQYCTFSGGGCYCHDRLNTVPTASNSWGFNGMQADNGSFFYSAIDTNNWHRVAVSAF